MPLAPVMTKHLQSNFTKVMSSSHTTVDLNGGCFWCSSLYDAVTLQWTWEAKHFRVGGRSFFSLSQGKQRSSRAVNQNGGRKWPVKPLLSVSGMHFSLYFRYSTWLYREKQQLNDYFVVNGRGSFLFVWLQYKPIYNMMICELNSSAACKNHKLPVKILGHFTGLIESFKRKKEKSMIGALSVN